MPEAAFLVIDSTEYMRNGDYFPNRLMAVQEAAQLLCNAKMEQNQENSLGFLTMGGQACNVVETLTADVDRVVASLTQIPLSGKRPFFARGLQIASLALSHRLNPRAEKRIIAFLGSPLCEDADELTKLAKKLRKDNFAVDVVAFGVEENIPLLQEFVEKVNKDGNSRILVIPDGLSMTDSLMSSAIFLGNDAVAASGGTGGASAAAGGFEFGFDPSIDPELAMVLRMSMEEEKRRLEQVAAAAAAQSAQGAAAAPAPPPPLDSKAPELSEDEELALALKLSEEAAATSTDSRAGDAEAAAALQDEDFLNALRATLQQQQQPGQPPKDDEKK